MSVNSIKTPRARYSCQSCGRCCTMWSVTVDEEKVKAIREHDWSHISKLDPFEKNRGPGDAYRLRMINGRCFFLDENNLCRIHAEVNYNAKPDGCKAFPLHYVEFGGHSYGRLSFYCPSVTKEEGKWLRDQSRWLKATRKAAGDVKRGEKLTLDGVLEISDKEANELISIMLKWTRDESIPISRALTRISGLLRLISERGEKENEAAIRKSLRQADDNKNHLLYEELGQKEGKASRAGPVFSLFLGADCKNTKLSRFAHFWNIRFFNLGLAKLSSKMMQAKASKGALRQIEFKENDLLRRYITHKIEARRMLAGDSSLFVGFNTIAAGYAVINLLARLSAVEHHRSSCDDHDIAAAVQAADLLVVEHTTLAHGPMFGHLVDAVLSAQNLFASMVKAVEKI